MWDNITEKGLANLVISSPNFRDVNLFAPFLDIAHLFDRIAVCGRGRDELAGHIQILKRSILGDISRAGQTKLLKVGNLQLSRP